MTPDLIKPKDLLFIIKYDGSVSERILLVQAPSQAQAIEKFHQRIDPEMREEYTSDKEFQEAIPRLHKVREKRFTIEHCIFGPDGIATVWER